MSSRREMAMPVDVRAEITRLPGNDVCVDCPTRQPQWASVSYGILMCLECSGAHRGLGVQTSFVRSVSMDSWTPEEITRMRCGGNAQLNQFLQRFNVDKTLPVAVKYHTAAAEHYRKRITALAKGETPPPADGVPVFDPSAHAEEIAAARRQSEESAQDRALRMRREAEDRMRTKFGGGGLSGVGSSGVGSGTGAGASGQATGIDPDAIGDALTQWTASMKSAASSATQYSSEALARLREQEVARRVQGSLSTVAATVRDPETHDQARRKAQESWNWLSSTTSSLFAQAQQRAAELRETWEAGQAGLDGQSPRPREEERTAQAAQADASPTGAVHSPHSAVEEDWLQQQIAAAHAELGEVSLGGSAVAQADPPAVSSDWDADGWMDAGGDDWDEPAGNGAATGDGGEEADSDGDEPAGVAGAVPAATAVAATAAATGAEVEASASAEQHASTEDDADFFAAFGVAD